MEDSYGERDNEIDDSELARGDEESTTHGEYEGSETEEVESYGRSHRGRRRGRRITFEYPKPRKPEEPEPPEPEPPDPQLPQPEPDQPDTPDDGKLTPQDRIAYLESRVRGFRIASAGDGLLRGGFGKLPTGVTDLMQQMANLAKAMQQFQLVGDNLNVQGSFDKGYTVSRENPCQQQQVNQE